MFQSTRPAWGATVHRGGLVDSKLVSIHAPRVGRDTSLVHIPGSLMVSIHAPRVGRDVVLDFDAWVNEGFNPRAPRGARRAAATS